MRRRTFLKIVGAVIAAPSLPIPVKEVMITPAPVAKLLAMDFAKWEMMCFGKGKMVLLNGFSQHKGEAILPIRRMEKRDVKERFGSGKVGGFRILDQ
jgi:hypothetical protein